MELDMRLGYCTKHGSTTECLQCTIDDLRKANESLLKINAANKEYADSADDECLKLHTKIAKIRDDTIFECYDICKEYYRPVFRAAIKEKFGLEI